MIRKIEEKDIEQCLNIYNFYIKESTATFECDTLNIDEFKERIKRITKNFPYLVYEYENKVLGYAYLDYFIDRKAAFVARFSENALALPVATPIRNASS